MALSVGRVFGLLELTDNFTSRIEDAARKLTDFGGKAEKIGKQVQEIGDKMSMGITLPLVGAAGAALKFSSDFERSMTQVVTLSGLSEDAMSGMRQQILDMAPAVGVGPGELAKGLLVVTSTGLRGAEAMEVLNAAAKASAVGLGDTDAVARAVTAAMNSYGKENLSAAQATDILYRAVKAGGAEATELAGVLGRVTGTASQMGISFQEVTTFIAAFTRLGVNAAEATTSMGAVMSTILKPTKEAEAALKEMGTSVDALRTSIKEKGMTQAMLDLVQSVQGNEDALAKIIPNVRALRGVLGTAGSQAETFGQVLKDVSDTTDTLDSAFQRTTNNAAFKWEQFWAKLEKVAITAGDRIAPQFNKLVDAAMPLLSILEKAITLFANLPPKVQTVALAFIGILAAIGPVLSIGGRLIALFGMITAALSGGAAAGAAGAGGAAAAGGLAGAATAAGTALLGLAIPAAIIGLLGALAVAVWKVVEAFQGLAGAWSSGGVRAVWDYLTAKDNDTFIRRWLGWGNAIEVVDKQSRVFGKNAQDVVLKVDAFNTSFSNFKGMADLGPGGGPIAAAGKAVQTFGDELLAAEAKIKALAPAVRDDLVKAIQSGAFTMEQLREKTTIGDLALQLLTDRVKAGSEAHKKAAKAAEDHAELLDKVRRAGEELTVGQKEQIRSMMALGISGGDMAKVIGAVDEQVDRYTNSLKQNSDVIADIGKNISKIPRNVQPLLQSRNMSSIVGPVTGGVQLHPDMIDWEAINAASESTLQKVAERSRNTYEFMARHPESFSKKTIQHFKEIADAADKELGGSAKGFGAAFDRTLDRLGKSFEHLANVAGDKFSKVAKNIGTFISAMSVAGKAGEEMKAGLDKGGTEGLMQFGAGALSAAGAIAQVTSTGTTASRAMQGMAAGAKAGAAFGPYGMAIGAAAGAITGLIRGLNAGRTAIKEFAASMGGFDALHAKLTVLGDAGEQLWIKMTQKTAKGDQKGAAAVIEEINKALATYEARLQSTIKLHNDELGVMIRMANQWQALPPQALAYVDQLVAAGRITEENAAALRKMGDFGADDFDRLMSKAKEFGVELSAMGPAFQQAALDAEAKEIISFFEEMIARGGDYNGLLVGTQEEISKVVQNSLQFGTVIPGNMRPWIEDLAKAGRLLDVNGEKITDTSNLKFGENIKSDLDDVVAKLQEMIDLLTKGLSGAMTAANQAVQRNPIRIPYSYEQQGDGDPRKRYTDPASDPVETPGAAAMRASPSGAAAMRASTINVNIDGQRAARAVVPHLADEYDLQVG